MVALMALNLMRFMVVVVMCWVFLTIPLPFFSMTLVAMDDREL